MRQQPHLATQDVQATNFTGMLEPGGRDFKTFAITYAGQTDLSVTINSLTGATAVRR